MVGLLQRVNNARVEVEGRVVGEIGLGLLAFIGIASTDQTAQADRLLKRMLSYRIFGDEDGKMNLSVKDINGGLLLVPQFTLLADTHKGTRPGFSHAAEPGLSEQIFDYLVKRARESHDIAETGVFGADMQVSLTNNGPATFWLEVSAESGQ